ncbi:MAG: secretion protein HlyD [Candidatus Parcubacteria bacterium]|nr:MAG: secretion protein HlyD [Candidatus Parcubacteria bacterium]
MIKRIFQNKKTIFLLILILGGIGYLIYSKNKNNQITEGYILAKVERGTIEKSISGTGYVTSTDIFEVKPSISGKILNIYSVEGSYIKKGELLFVLSDSDIKRQIRDLELDIENSKINLTKTQDDYQRIIRGDDLRKNYENLLKNLNDIFIDYPDDLETIRKTYFDKDLDPFKDNIDYYLYYFPQSQVNSTNLQKTYNELKNNFVLISQNLQEAKFNTQNAKYDLTKNSYDLLLETQDFVKSGLDLIRRLKEDLSLSQSYHTKQEIIDRHYNDLNSIYEKYSGYIDYLSSMVNTLNNYQDTLKQKEYDIQSLKLAIQQKENKLNDLKEDLKDYYIYAPVGGIVQDINVKLNDIVSPNSVLMKIVSNEKIVEVYLNEIDAAEVKLGQKVVLTFDALPDLKLSGEVFYISAVGEINQGVVNYLVKINMKNSPKVKIGMTANAEIITNIKRDILLVPNSVIKSMNDKNYIEIPDEKESIRQLTKEPVKLNYPLKKVFIKTGLSDNNKTEVLEGLKEGDIIVVKKIDNSNNNNKQSQGLFQRLMPNPRQFAPQQRPQNTQRQF